MLEDAEDTWRKIIMMNKISIITFIGMIITGLISVAVFLAPVSGFLTVSYTHLTLPTIA